MEVPDLGRERVEGNQGRLEKIEAEVNTPLIH